MERINWRYLALGGFAVALIVGVAIWRSGDSDTIVAGGENPTVEPDQPAKNTEEPSAETIETPTATDSDAEQATDPSVEAIDPETEPADETLEPATDEASSGDAEAGDEEAGDPGDAGGPSPGQSTSAPNPNQDPTWSMRCILYIHGAGTTPEALGDEQWEDDLLYLTPASPNNEWPHFWLYDGPHNYEFDPDDSTEPYDNLVSYLTDYLDQNQCGPVMMHGASNGGGLAAKIYCSGEDFGGRLWMAIVDDPVPDAGVIGCAPSPAVQRSLFIHSTELVESAESFVDNRCSQTDVVEYPWYCQDDIGFDKAEYEAHIGQETILGREEHVATNNDETSFWVNVHTWWATIDQTAYDQSVSR